MPRAAIIWGGTGNMKVLHEILHTDYELLGYFDNNPTVIAPYKGMPCLGTRAAFDPWLDGRSGEEVGFVVSIGPGGGPARREVYADLVTAGLRPLTAVHPTAHVADGATIDDGSQVYANATICVDARLGKNVIVNTAASVDHECVLEDGVSIGPGARLAGLVRVGRDADVYTGAIVLPRVTVGRGATVGAGAVVLRDVPDGAVVVGNPARPIRRQK